MKKGNVLRKILAILVVVLIAIVSFVGIYTKKLNKYENILPDYQLGMDIKGSKIITIKVDDSTEKKTYDKDGNLVEDDDSTSAQVVNAEGTETETTEENAEGNTTVEEPVNKEEVLTKENYEKCKKIIEKRLESLNILEYTVRQDTTTGEITVQIPDDSKAEMALSALPTKGKFEIVDADTNEVLMDNSDLKETTAGLATTTNSSGTPYYVVSIQIGFNGKGKDKLTEITKNYSTQTNTTVSENTTDGSDTNTTASENTTDGTDTNTTNGETAKEKKIKLKIDDETVLETSFGQVLTGGVLQLTMGNENSTTSEITENLTSSTSLAARLNSGEMPIVYTLDKNVYEASDITVQDIQLVLIVLASIFAVLLIVMAIKYKKNGILCIFSNIGFVASLLLLVRLSNVVLTIEGITTITLAVILNYIFTWALLKAYKNKKEGNAFSDVMLKSVNIIIPLIIASIVFTFSSWLPIASCGMVGIWAIILWIICSFTLTKTLAKNN